MDSDSTLASFPDFDPKGRFSALCNAAPLIASHRPDPRPVMECSVMMTLQNMEDEETEQH